jgi:hypothetical protein
MSVRAIVPRSLSTYACECRYYVLITASVAIMNMTKVQGVLINNIFRLNFLHKKLLLSLSPIGARLKGAWSELSSNSQEAAD